MNQFQTVENVDAYHELANAVVVLACDDYRDYKKNFREIVVDKQKSKRYNDYRNQG